MPKLSETEIQERLATLKGWDRLGDQLVKTWRFASANRALEFVNRVAEHAIQKDHFPDVILSYRDVRVELATHAEGGLTERDFEFACEVDHIPTDR
jgi:4a-hydroxytetrahydrobiopterin dehydratase